MHALSEILDRIVDRQALKPAVCVAIQTGLEQANDNLAKALEGQFWRRPYLIPEILIGCPIWPCGHSLEDLLFLCRVKLVQQRKSAGYTAISLRAADKVLVRLIAAAADLERSKPQ